MNGKGPDERHDAVPHQSRHPAPRRDADESGIGRLHENQGNGSPLGFVAVEGCLRRCSTYDLRELAGEVVRILQAGVHPLRPHR